MKKLFLVLLALCLFTALGTAAHAEIKPMKLRLASAFPPPNVALGSYAAKVWMDTITKKTDGKVTFQTFWGGALGKPPEHLKIVGKGVADLVLTNAHYTPGKLPLAQFEYVFPFGPVDPVVVTKAKLQLMSEFPEFARDLAKRNVVQIMNASGTVYQILSKTPVKTLADFQGQKISLIGRYFGRWVKVAGAIPVVAAAHDRYTMLQTGVVDMDLLPVDLFASFKIQEQAKNFVGVRAMTGNFFDLYMNKKRFDKMPKELQKMFLETGAEVAMKVATEIVPAWTKKVMAQFKKSGVVFHDLPEAERDKWAQMIPDIPAEWAVEVEAQGYPGWKIVDRWQELTTKYGYKWPRKWGVKK